jgi:anti-anti-sigma factor
MSIRDRESALNGCLVNLSGPLNVSRASDAIQLFSDVAERGIQRVVINLEDVPFIDSRGLAALIAGYKLFGSDPRNFQLIGIQDQPRLVFELTGFDQVFETLPYLQASQGYRLPVFVPRQAALEDLAA